MRREIGGSVLNMFNPGEQKTCVGGKRGGDQETGGEQDESMRVEKEHGEETMARSDSGLLSYTLLVFRFYFLLPQNLVWQVNFRLLIE